MKNNVGNLLNCFRLRVNSLQELYLVLTPEHQHWRVTSAVTGLLIYQLWHLQY